VLAGGIPEAGGEFVLRIGQYLAERGYLTPKDVPGLVRVAETGDLGPFLRLAQRFVARKIGVRDDQPIPAKLAFLSAERAAESWTSYLRTTTLFQERVKKWEEEKKRDPKAKPPEPQEVAGWTPDAWPSALERFRFRNDPKPDPKKPEGRTVSLADTPRSILQQAAISGQR
jgi:hypothetical protein